jgi:hypothetical protein
MVERADKKKINMVFLLVTVAIVLGAILVYAFVIKPSYSGYVTKMQTQATNQEDYKILGLLLSEINQTGGIILPIPGMNQTVTLILPQLCGKVANTSK